MGQLSPGDNHHPQAPGVGAALEKRQMGEGMPVGWEETFEGHTGMKKLHFFFLPLKDSTT